MFSLGFALKVTNVLVKSYVLTNVIENFYILTNVFVNFNVLFVKVYFEETHVAHMEI